MSLSLTIPLVVIGAPIWSIVLITVVIFASALSGREGVALLYRLAHNIIIRPGLYIWGLVVAISGPQDFVAISFYIVAALQLWGILKNFIGEVLLILFLIADRKGCGQ